MEFKALDGAYKFTLFGKELSFTVLYVPQKTDHIVGEDNSVGFIGPRGKIGVPVRKCSPPVRKCSPKGKAPLKF